jgi:hypothetical protein
MLTVFSNGEWFGTPEQAFEIGAVYLLFAGRESVSAK